MSIFDKVAGYFTGAVSDVVEGAKDAWGAIKTVWAFLVSIYRIGDEAWNWVVNGIDWLTGNIEGWVSDVYNTFAHILTQVIPEAAQWALGHAIGWAQKLVDDVEKWVSTAFTNVKKWVEHGLHKLESYAKGLVDAVIKWVTGPIRWVIHNGEKIVNLLFHPERLAKWIVGALVVPLVQWILKSSLPVMTWLLRGFASEGSEFAHLIEDLLEKVV